MGGSHRRSAAAALAAAESLLHTETQGIFSWSHRSAYLRVTSVTSSISPSLRVIGLRPRWRNRSLATCSSFSSASLRGLGRLATSTPVRSEIIAASSRTRWVSVIWLKIATRSPLAGAFSSASWMHLTVSWMWMNARVWPPVPWTVSG